jgi:hypothetical protein
MSITSTSQLKMFAKIITVYSDRNMKHINIPHRENVDFLMVGM